MALDDSRINTGLGLGLSSLEEETPLNIKINNNNHGFKKHKMMMKKKASSSSSTLLMRFEPCLTLGLFSSSSEEYAVNNNSSNSEENNSNDVNYNRQGSDSGPPHSISSVSSLSNNTNNNVCINIKRERAADYHGISSDQEMEASRVNDEDEDCSNTIRKKLRLTKEQSSLLEESFKHHSTLHPQNQKQALASQLNLQPRQVEVWFQNRRARTKLKQTEVDCEFLKKCCETLTDENRRLQKEIQELKAIKASQQQPFFMQLPAATLTICPSCERRGRNGSIVTTSDGSPNKSFSMAVANSIKPLYCNPFTNPSAAC